jgi:hypothetical protein
LLFCELGPAHGAEFEGADEDVDDDAGHGDGRCCWVL